MAISSAPGNQRLIKIWRERRTIGKIICERALWVRLSVMRARQVKFLSEKLLRRVKYEPFSAALAGTAA